MADIRITLQELKILSVLVAGREMYGYEIKKELEDNILLGGLYNVLKQLERKELVKSRWGTEEVTEGARRRYYEITGEGSRVLREAQEFFMVKWGVQTVSYEE
ncbi:MAG: helix-turn-helix transcriptional regulator [Cytophagales bacterium]|nr:helix-turn-helix transcriptional regulator [Cytophagales bacterium]